MRPREGRTPACLLIVTALLATLTASPAQSPVPEKVTPQHPVALRTMTPLGEAVITLPAGVPLENFRIEGEWITVTSGPFSARLPLADVVPPPPPPVPTPEPTPEEPAPTPEPPPPWQAGLEALQNGEPLAVIAAAGVVLAGYGLLMTLLWWRLRRKIAKLEDA